MSNLKFLQSIKTAFFSVLVLSGSAALAQQIEYRITDDRRYQYLSNRHEAGMIFDESLGTYYTDVTVRTFYLETLRKGFIPGNISYDAFIKMTLAEQRALLNQPFSERDCSSNNISSECLDFLEQEIQIPVAANAQIVDLAPKCIPPGESPQSKMSLTSRLLVNPNDASVENNDCEEKAPSATTDDSRQKQQMKTVKIILGKD